MDPSVIVEALNTTDTRSGDARPWRFEWRGLHGDGSTMFAGATWALVPGGAATFEATVAGGADGDAWVIWHVDLLDGDGFILGSLATEHPVDGDWRKFVLVMPIARRRCRFRCQARFDPALWPHIQRLKMYSSVAHSSVNAYSPVPPPRDITSTK